MTHQLIISRLIESGHQIFLPLGGDSTELIVRNQRGEIYLCKAQTASIDGENSSVLKVSRERRFDVIAVYDPMSKNVWIIPSEALKGLTAIRLGKKWDDYLIPEPRSVEFRERREKRKGYLEALRNQARGIGEDQKGALE